MATDDINLEKIDTIRAISLTDNERADVRALFPKEEGNLTAGGIAEVYGNHIVVHDPNEQNTSTGIPVIISGSVNGVPGYCVVNAITAPVQL